MENDYNKNYFWVKRDLEGNKHRYFRINGQLIIPLELITHSD